MNKHLTKVYSRFPGPDTPCIPDADLILAIQHHLDELKMAVTQNNIILVAESLARIEYNLSKTIISSGLHEVWHKIFAELHDRPEGPKLKPIIYPEI